MTDLKTVSIKGKPYVTVNERLKHFREKFPNYSLISNLVNVDGDVALIRAEIVNEDNRIVATGTAYERKDDKGSFVNATSHVENAETSAWGRALANFGIGIDASVASAEEVTNAIDDRIKPQGVDSATIRKIDGLVKDTGSDPKKVYDYYKVKGKAWTVEQANQAVVDLEMKLVKANSND